MRGFVFAACALAIWGCSISGQPVESKEARDAGVVKLFEIDGMTVYRFWDYDACHYLVTGEDWGYIESN